MARQPFFRFGRLGDVASPGGDDPWIASPHDLPANEVGPTSPVAGNAMVSGLGGA
jgi:hypothetical protein